MDENTSVAFKETFYDRIFKPQKITLENGHTVLRRRSRTPMYIILLVVAVILSIKMTGFDIGLIFRKFNKMMDLMRKLFNPKWEFVP